MPCTGVPPSSHTPRGWGVRRWASFPAAASRNLRAASPEKRFLRLPVSQRGSTFMSQPAPYGSRSASAGCARTASFRATTWPSTGESTSSGWPPATIVKAFWPCRTGAPISGKRTVSSGPTSLWAKSSRPTSTAPPSGRAQAWPARRWTPVGTWNQPKPRACAGTASPWTKRQKGMKRRRYEMARAYSRAFTVYGLRSSCSFMDLSPLSSLGAAPVGVFVHHRHAIHDPAEDQDADRHDRESRDDLTGARDVAVRDVPVEGDERNVEAVEDHAKDREDAGDPGQPRARTPRRVSEHERRQEDEAEHLEEIPGAPAGREKVEASARNQALQPDEEVREKDDRAALGEGERDAVEIHGGGRVEPVVERAVGKRALHDHHADARRETRHEEENRQERRVPERVQLARRHEEEGAERGLVERRERDADDDDADRQRPEEPAQLDEAEPLERGGRELEPEHHQI